MSEERSGTTAAPRPTGTVTFLFSDIEGSTLRWERDPNAMAPALARHDALLRDAVEARGGHVFKAMGDAFCTAFARASDALAAALDGQRALLAQDFSAVDGVHVRMALHTGLAEERGADYFGSDVNRVARLLAIAHGDQVLVSGAAADLLKDSMPPGTGLRDLGAHRLKDLARAEHVYQLVAADLPATFPALRSLELLPNNLPAQLTSFVGREEAVAEIEALMRRHRLVTLVGTGGVGKTRCAIQAGAELLDESEDGVWLVEFATISDPSLVAVTIAQVLGVRETPSRPILEAIVAHLERRQLLLVLDNCEHVIAEARSVVAAILHACPDVRVLATSRESLSTAGEQVFRLPTLPVPYPAVTLFVDRASASHPQFALTDENAPAVAEIVERLDGIPLAIELAAARVRVLSPQQLLLRLNERFRVLTGGDRTALPRQQTLRAAIDWSFNLLDERDRGFFRRLSIFAGGWTLAAAAAVCGDDGAADEFEVLDALSSLVDKSLVVVEELGDDRRYGMLNSIREYGLERLAEADELAAAADKHGRYYVEFVRSLAPLVHALEDVEWKRAFAPELGNVRAAIDWAMLEGHDPEVGLALLAEVEWPELLTTPRQALRWFQSALDFADAMPDELTHSRILRHYVMLEWLAGHPLSESEQIASRAIEIARATGNADEIARAFANLGSIYTRTARFEDADRAFLEAYKMPERLSRSATNAVLRMWAVSELQRGDVDLARSRFSDVARLERPGSEAHASALLNLAEAEYASGNIARAREAAERARDIYERLNSALLVIVLSNLGAYAIAADDIEGARMHLRQALQAQAKAGEGTRPAVLEHHALLAALEGDHERAALLAGFTDLFYSSRGEVRQYTEHCGHARLAAMLETIYSAEERAHRMSLGARLTEEQAFAEAAAIHEATIVSAVWPPKRE